MSNFRRSLLFMSKNAVSPSLIAPLKNGDVNIYDLDNNLTISPEFAGYDTSDENGTHFVNNPGQGIIYSNNSPHNIKSYSFEVFLDTNKLGTISNYEGMVMFLIWYRNYMSLYQVANSSNWKLIGTEPRNTSGKQWEVFVTENNQSGVWHKVCVNTNFDYLKLGSNEEYSVDLYIDSVYITSIPNPSYYYFGNPSTPFNIVIGNSQRLIANGPTSTNVNPLCGTIRNLRMFRRTLTTEEALLETL